MSAQAGALNEAQQRVVSDLGATAEHRPTFPDGLAVGLRAKLSDGLSDAALRLGNDNLYVTKYLLSQVLGCEPRHLHEHQAPFEWSVPVARGTVAHKAIELSVNWRTTPLAPELVDHAISSLAHDGSPISDYLTHLPEAERAQLRSEAANATQAFLEGFPPLRSNPQWKPAVEVRGRYEAVTDRITLSGKVDLSLGGPAGDRSGRVFIDLKTGRRSRNHVDDLRFYALVETVRFGTPPRALASYYLDESRLVVEQVTADVLWSAVARTVDAINTHLALVSGRAEPEYRPSLACSWCPLVSSCDHGRRFLDSTDEDELELLG